MFAGRRLGSLAFIFVASIGLSASWAQAPSGSSPTFTQAQVVEGRAAYRQHCVACHGQRLEGMHLSPALTGERFDRMWRGKTLDLLAFHVRRMPQQPVADPGSLSEETYTNLVAYILQSNGFEWGETALPADTATLAKLSIPKLPGSDVDLDAPVAGAAEASEALKNLPALTDAMLQKPADGDWLQWGRSYSGHSYSPLTKINRENVKDLKLAWRAPLREGMTMPMPLVHGGVMFVNTFPDTVLALDATNGAVLWRHQHKSAQASQKMGLALHGDRVFVPTSDLHVKALNAKTGELVWDHEITRESTKGRGGYQIRSAPLVAGGKVIQGVTASFIPRGGFIVAIDIETGKESWRFNTIPRPGEPGDNTWNDVPLDERSGGSVWHQGTYDPELNLIYFGVAPTYDTGPLLHSVEKEGVTSDALYTNCTIALNPETGELKWFYQHMPNDQWDLDWVFERQIATVPVDGKPRKVVMNTGKMAVLDALDAATGEYLFSVDMGVQNVITHIDEKTGAKTIDEEKLPDPDRPCVICPSAFGARSWPPTAFSPKTNFVYVPIMEWCMTFGKEGIRLLTSGIGITTSPHPDVEDGFVGRIQAVNVADQSLAWVKHIPAPPTTSTLATGGGVVFAGDLEPSLKAFDDATGEVLWQTALDDLPSGGVITYSVGDAQYVAVLAGLSNLHVRDLARTYYGFRAERGETVASANGGAAIWVFALGTSEALE